MKVFKKLLLCVVALPIVFISLLLVIGFAADRNAPKIPLSAGKDIETVIPDNAAAIESVLEQCGLPEISFVQHDEMLDNAHFDGEKGYRINTKDYNNIIMYLDANYNVHLLKYIDNILYEDNTVKALFTDYTLTLDEITKLQVYCQEQIKKILVSPSSAKFPNFTEWGFSKSPERTIVQGYVDSQNMFGAFIRSTFQFTIENGITTSVIFDGEEIMK